MDEQRDVFEEQQLDAPVLSEDQAEKANDFAGEEETPGGESPAAQEQEYSVPGTAQRDFHGEALELLQAYPHLRGQQLPGEVVAECARGTRLLDAYRAHEAGESRSELERVRKENEVLRHNADAARRGPVGGVSGSVTDTRPGDPFLDGFDGED